MSVFHAIILGIVEGITEFLPISSTGHLILTSQLFQIPITEFLKSFEIAIQLGAILSVLVLYARRLKNQPALMKKIAVAFLPSAILGFAFYRIIKVYLLGDDRIVLWSLLLGGIFLIGYELVRKQGNERTHDLDQMSYVQCLLIGLCQSVSMVPGVSRAAATIVGGLVTGLNRQIAVEFSFLLAIPTMTAAVAFDLWKNASQFTVGQFDLLALGFAVSFVVALLSVKFLLSFIKRHTFMPFGVYRILFVMLFWFFIL